MDKLLSPSILVTGATGFIGGTIARQLSPLYPIHITGRSLNRIDQLPGLPFEQIDLSNRHEVMAIKCRPSVVVHAAGFAAPWGKRADFYKHNVQATQHMIDFALANGVNRFIYISSASVYSALHHQWNVSEEDIPKQFIGAYAYAKFMAELRVLEAERMGLEIMIIRPRAVIGAGDTTVLPRIILAHQTTGLRKISREKIMTEITTVTNLVEAIRLGVNAPASAMGHIYNITDGKAVELWPLLGYVFQQLKLPAVQGEVTWSIAKMAAYTSEFFSMISGKEPILSLYTLSLLGRSLTLNIDKAKKVLGYLPLQTTTTGINEYINWINQQHEQPVLV